MEFAEKESMRKRLEMLATTVLPGAKLLPFGSTANGLSLRNSGALHFTLGRPAVGTTRIHLRYDRHGSLLHV